MYNERSVAKFFCAVTLPLDDDRICASLGETFRLRIVVERTKREGKIDLDRLSGKKRSKHRTRLGGHTPFFPLLPSVPQPTTDSSLEKAAHGCFFFMGS